MILNKKQEIPTNQPTIVLPFMDITQNVHMAVVMKTNLAGHGFPLCHDSRSFRDPGAGSVSPNQLMVQAMDTTVPKETCWKQEDSMIPVRPNLKYHGWINIQNRR